MKVSKYWRRALPVFGAAFLCTAAWAQEETTPTRPAYVDDILTKISELSTSVSTLSTNVDAISTSVAAIDTSVDAVNTTVAGVSTSLDTLSTNVDAVDTTVDEISTSVSGVNTTVDALSGSVNDTGDDVDDVISKINRLLRRVDDLETAIADLEDDVGFPATRVQRAELVQRGITDSTWYDVLNHTGAGLLHRIRAKLTHSHQGTHPTHVDIQITVDGGATQILRSTTQDTDVDRRGESNRMLDLPYLIRFKTSVRVQARWGRPLPTRIGTGGITASVLYSTDI